MTNTWRSVFITTGENNILEYTKTQGSAARVIPLTNFRLSKKDENYFTNLNSSVENYYGRIGAEFIKRWRMQNKRGGERLKQLTQIYQKIASENDVMRRVALHFAFIVYVSEVLNEMFELEGMNIRINDLTEFFLTICSENNHVNRAKNELIGILEELEANRNHIFGEYEPHGSIYAIVNQNGLFLTIDYLKRRLQVDGKQIREAWKSENLTVKHQSRGNVVDYTAITHKGRSFRVVQVSQDFLLNQGFEL